MPMPNDSPNGLLIDTACFGLGAILGALTNHLVYSKIVSSVLDYFNGLMIIAFLLVIGLLAIQKSKRLAFGPRLYALLMGLVGWCVGTFIILELHAK